MHSERSTVTSKRGRWSPSSAQGQPGYMPLLSSLKENEVCMFIESPHQSTGQGPGRVKKGMPGLESGRSGALDSAGARRTRVASFPWKTTSSRVGRGKRLLPFASSLPSPVRHAPPDPDPYKLGARHSFVAGCGGARRAVLRDGRGTL